MDTKKFEKLGNAAVAFLKVPLLALAGPIRAFYDIVGNSLLAGLSVLAFSILGSSAYYVYSHEESWNRKMNADAAAVEGSNALRELEIVTRGARVREFVVAAANATADGLTVSYVPVPDSAGLVAYWNSDDASGLFGPVALQKDGAGVPLRTQTALIPASQFGAAWTTGRIMSVSVVQVLSISNLPAVRKQGELTFRVP